MSSHLVNHDKIKNMYVDNLQHDDKVKLTSSGGISVYADTSPIPTADDDDRKGWLFNKTSAGSGKFNYYIYGNTGSSHQFTLADLKSIHLSVSIDSYINNKSVPFINVYTKPTGSGDAGAFYHSRQAYSINMSNQKIVAGEHITLWALKEPELNENKRMIELETYTLNGDGLSTEEILYIAFGSDSASSVPTKILTINGGYELGEIKRNIEFVV